MTLRAIAQRHPCLRSHNGSVTASKTSLFYTIEVPRNLAIALILLIAAPGPPLFIRRAGMAGAHVSFVLSLQVTLAILAIAVTPLTLKTFALFFPQNTQAIDYLLVAKQVAIVQFLPLTIGLTIRATLQELADKINRFLKTMPIRYF